MCLCIYIYKIQCLHEILLPLQNENKLSRSGTSNWHIQWNGLLFPHKERCYKDLANTHFPSLRTVAPLYKLWCSGFSFTWSRVKHMKITRIFILRLHCYVMGKKRWDGYFIYLRSWISSWMEVQDNSILPNSYFKIKKKTKKTQTQKSSKIPHHHQPRLKS